MKIQWGSARQLRILDAFSVFVAQPLVAGIAIFGLVTNVREAAEPFFIWFGVILMFLSLGEAVFTFAIRVNRGRPLNGLWLRLVGAEVATVLAYASAFRTLGLTDGGQISHSPATALYFSIITWTTVGYGDVTPPPDARLFAAAEAIFGLVFNSALIGLLMHAVTSKAVYPGRDRDRDED